jgi:8-oxo-dGTP pyrophosphatase MutT (NUDIX family)
MSASAHATAPMEKPTSCGTLIFNRQGQLLLCHVTGTGHWDIPKGMRQPGESTLDAAKRELKEETGLELDDALFEEIGSFDYVKHKRLHLYQLRAPECLDSLGKLGCTSYFIHPVTGEPTPEMDGYTWAFRDEIPSLCLLQMARQLLMLKW